MRSPRFKSVVAHQHGCGIYPLQMICLHKRCATHNDKQSSFHELLKEIKTNCEKLTEAIPFLDSISNDLPKLNLTGPKVREKSPLKLQQIESPSEVQAKCLPFIYSQTYTYSQSKLFSTSAMNQRHYLIPSNKRTGLFS